MRRVLPIIPAVFGLVAAACSGSSVTFSDPSAGDAGYPQLDAGGSSSGDPGTGGNDSGPSVTPDASSSGGLDAGTTPHPDAGGHDSGTPGTDASADASPDTGLPDSGSGGPKDAKCTGTFGAGITGVHGRLDGTVLAVIPPSDFSCPMPNKDHVTLDIVMGGQAYRILVNVNSTVALADPRVQIYERNGALLGDPWSDGWHANASLDYVGDLGLNAGLFTPYDIGPLSDKIGAAIAVGEKISVYAQGFTTNDGAHDVHRYGSSQDGAIVVGIDSGSPRWLLFHFSNQTF